MGKNFLLEANKEEAVLNLRDGDEIIDKVVVGTGHDLAEKLLPSIEALLKKHALQTTDIQEFLVTSDLPEGYSSRRISETVASIYNFSIKDKAE